jgi:hypothetical protein
VGSRYPVLIGDCDPTAKCINQVGIWNGCHDALVLPISNDRHSLLPLKELITRIQAELLFRFIDVVCVFIADLGGCAAATKKILEWVNTDQHQTPGVKPRLIAVVHTRLEGVDLQRLEHHSGFSRTFSGLTVVIVKHPSELSPSALYIDLKAKIWNELAAIRDERQEARLLFSASHLQHLFHLATKSFATSQSISFDWLLAARDTATLLPHSQACIREFLSLTKQLSIPVSRLTTFLASALLMNCYPVEMHCGWLCVRLGRLSG